MHQSKPSDFIERNDLKAFLSLLRDWMAIFLITAISIWANNIYVYLISVWAIGIFQFAIGEALLHEAVHFNLFKIKSWNEQLEFLYVFPVFRTVSSYREQHFPHHSYFLSEKDYIPEYYEMLGLNKPNKNVFFLLFVKLIMGFSVYNFIDDIHGLLKGVDWRPFKTGFKLLVFWLVVVLSFYLSGNLEILLLYWFVPLVWPFSCYSCWSEVQEHFNTISHSRSNLDFLTNLLTHNTGYHYVHHLYPTIPWYKLPEAHEAFSSDNPDISYGMFDTYRQWTRKSVVSHASGTDSV
ncbi:fatty acid desaturase [Nostoc sp. CENA67]|uniref:Fatty acid desaturase n=1 Tax=Amazonocrinis nigriterrae CENA67 TaxID=2794033 RepID=A0A8J7HLI5_9NOST|nr:fatty acid desaturase [Amazonocrinis nigriterrae]MBH8561836.1 fatty acid desaturase [Amazonocrinis nigriterrae CENA67]